MAVPKLVPGTTGDIVKALQHALIANGYSIGPTGVDGKFGNATLGGLEAFQGNAALPVQAYCDKACWAALYSG